MRLYLSSYQFGDHAELFAALVTGERRGWVIMNALDGLDEERRQADIATQVSSLASLGLVAEDFDLRDHEPDWIRQDFGNPDFVWVRGGNVFTLRAAMARSGVDALITQGLRNDTFVYAGFSAGACVLAPSLSGLELCDPTEVCVGAYGSVRFDGLGILDRAVVPHLDSPEHPESVVLDLVAASYDRSRKPYWALRDGQALIANGSHPKVI